MAGLFTRSRQAADNIPSPELPEELELLEEDELELDEDELELLEDDELELELDDEPPLEESVPPQATRVNTTAATDKVRSETAPENKARCDM